METLFDTFVQAVLRQAWWEMGLLDPLGRELSDDGYRRQRVRCVVATKPDGNLTVTPGPTSFGPFQREQGIGSAFLETHPMGLPEPLRVVRSSAQIVRSGDTLDVALEIPNVRWSSLFRSGLVRGKK